MSLCTLIGIMCINQCEKLLTIDSCQASKNRNVIPVRLYTDQSSRSVSHGLPFSVSLAEIHFDDLKGRLFLPLFKYFRVWFHWETWTPPYVSGGPACMWKVLNAVKHSCWIIFTSKRFSFFLIILLMQLCANSSE